MSIITKEEIKKLVDFQKKNVGIVDEFVGKLINEVNEAEEESDEHDCKDTCNCKINHIEHD